MKSYRASSETHANKSNITSDVKKECMTIIDGMKKKKEKEVKLYYRIGVTTKHELKAPLWFSYIQICNTLDIPEVLVPTIEDQFWDKKTFWMSNDATVSVLSVGFVCGFAASNEYEEIPLSPFHHRRRQLHQMTTQGLYLDSGLPILTAYRVNTSHRILHTGVPDVIPVRRHYQHLRTDKLGPPEHSHTFGHPESMKKGYVFEGKPLVGKGRDYLGTSNDFHVKHLGSFDRATPTGAGGALLSYPLAMDRNRAIDALTNMELLRGIQIGDLAVNLSDQRVALPHSGLFASLSRYIRENHIRNRFTPDTLPVFNDLELDTGVVEANLRRINENTVLGVFDHVFPKQPNIEKEKPMKQETQIVEKHWDALAYTSFRSAPHIGYGSPSLIEKNMRGLIDGVPDDDAIQAYITTEDIRTPGSRLHLQYNLRKESTVFLQNQEFSEKTLWATYGVPPFVFHNCLFSDVDGVGAVVNRNAFDHVNNVFGCEFRSCSGSKRLLSASVLANNLITKYRYSHNGKVWIYNGPMLFSKNPHHAVRGPVGTRGATLLALRVCDITTGKPQIHFSTGCFFGNEEELKIQLRTSPNDTRVDYEKAIEDLKAQLSW